MKTLIVIPAYNEELTIGSVVALTDTGSNYSQDMSIFDFDITRKEVYPDG